MAAQIEDLKTKVTNATTVEASAKALIDGFSQKLNDAVQQALANGATQDELKPLFDLSAGLDAATTDLQNSITANT